MPRRHLRSGAPRCRRTSTCWSARCARCSYLTPAELDIRFAALRADLDGERTLAQAFLAIARFTATIRCGHTWPNFSNQPKAVREALLENPDRVPFEFRWLDGRMVVTRDLTADGALPRGTEILALEGVASREVLARLMRVTRADGGNDAKRRALLEVAGTQRHETFDVFLPLVVPGVRGRIALDVRRPGERRARVDVPALTYAARVAGRPAAGERLGWRLDTADPALAVLRMPTWAVYDVEWDWKAFVDDAFATLARSNPGALVVDLRGNEGGLDVGDAVLAHLVDAPVPLPAGERRVRYRRVPDDLAKHLDTWDPSFRDWGDAAVALADGWFALRRDGDAAAAALAPVPPRYDGPVYVLVDASNSSATFRFAELVQRTGRATLVGEPTGGNRRGINGGAFFFLKLPNTGIEVDVPLIATFPPGNPPDAGVTPDVVVVPTAGDVAAGRDAAMAAVRALLVRKRT